MAAAEECLLSVESAPNIRAQKTRRIIEFWKENPTATLSKAVKETGCARSACQRWRTTLRRQGKLGNPPPSQDGIGFFDRFKPRPPREVPEDESPRASAPTSPSNQPSDAHGTQHSPPAPAPPHPEAAQPEASSPAESVDDVHEDLDVQDDAGDEPPRRRDIEFRLW